MKRKHKLQKSQLRQTMADAAKAAKRGGREICGFLVDNGYFLEIVKVRNKTKRGGGFSFYAGEVRKLERAVERLNHEIAGTFHSHPVGLPEPGESDIANAEDDSLMLVIDVTDKEAGLWHIKNRKKKKLSIELI